MYQALRETTDRRGNQPKSIQISLYAPQALPPDSASPKPRIRDAPLVNGGGQLGRRSFTEDSHQIGVETDGIRLAETSYEIPSVRRICAFAKALDGEVSSARRRERPETLAFEGERSRESVASDSGWIVQRVDAEDVFSSAQDPIPSLCVVVEALADTPTVGETQRPGEIQFANGAVDISPALATPWMISTGMKHDDFVAEEAKKLLCLIHVHHVVTSWLSGV
jgi:hypothetical protein